MTQFQNMRRKWKQKRRNFEITEILKRRNFEAGAERGDANLGISVLWIFSRCLAIFPSAVDHCPSSSNIFSVKECIDEIKNFVS